MDRRREQDLIRRAAGGDRAAAAETIRAFQPSVYAYILRMSGRPDVAEDVVQEAFVRVLTNLDRFDERYRFSTWLFTIARRLYVNSMQKHRPNYDSDLVGAWQGQCAPPGEPVERAEARDLARAAIQEALLTLPLTQREVVVLFHQLEWPIARIAAHLEIPEGTVKSHLHRGRRRLREALADIEQAREGREAWA